jgi:hypothetical protein
LGQDGLADKKKEQVQQLFVVVDAGEPLQMSSKKPIRQVLNEHGKTILTVRPIKGGPPWEIESFPNDFDKVLKVSASKYKGIVYLWGKGPGATRMTLIDADGKKETVEVTVAIEFFVFQNSTKSLQLATKKPIKNLNNPGQDIVRLERVADDPSTIKVTGLAVGETRFTLTGEDRKTETYSVVVRSEKDPGKGTIVFFVGEDSDFQMSTKRPIREILYGHERVATIELTRDDPTTVLVTARGTGVTRMKVTDVDGTIENYRLIVREERFRGRNGKNTRNQVFLAEGETLRWPHRVEGLVQFVFLNRDIVDADLDPKDPTMVLLTAKKIGRGRLEIQGDGKSEKLEVNVREAKRKENSK